MSESRALSPKDVARLLDAGAQALRAEVAALPAPMLAWHPAPGGWCVKEVIGHLIEADRRGFAGRIRIILASRDPALAAWDQAVVARERRDCERDVEGLLGEFLALRAAGVTLTGGLGAADLERGGQHPKVGYLKVGDLLHEWIHHDRNHLRQILANAQEFVWPSMGAAQGFAGE